MATPLQFDEKLAQALIVLKVRAENIEKAKNAMDKAKSDLNDLISKRLKKESDGDKRLKILEISQNPLNAIEISSKEKLSINPSDLKILGEKYKSAFSDLNVAPKEAPKEDPAVSSETPASK